MRNALQSDISGYLLGNCGLDEFVQAVRAVGGGSTYVCAVAAARVTQSLTRPRLTMREIKILRLLARNKPAVVGTVGDKRGQCGRRAFASSVTPLSSAVSSSFMVRPARRAARYAWFISSLPDAPREAARS